MDFVMIETGWLSIIPPLLAITLALITKEVYSSLFIGLFSGILIYTAFAGGNIFSAAALTFDMMSSKISDNSYMIIFLALLWAVVMLVSKSGGSYAYGRWAGSRLKTKRSAALATSLLGVLVFIDDGFNCLTVGTVMRPIFDRLKISREKLAYIIDATAAPVCIIAPVSSWAVAVASEVSETGGFNVFLSTIPYNLYAILTIAMVLIICAILGMAYVGGFFEGTSFSEAIGYNPTAGLSLGAFAGLITAFALYIPRKIMKPKEYMSCVVDGIGSIVPPMMILILSWTLGGVCRQLIGTGVFISGFVSSSNLPFGFLPFLLFVIAALMSFSMGTSWGTFGMLIPIVTMICSVDNAAAYLIPALGATLAGSVYGDHCSPISDTTILASTGAECVHIKHVETQLPYATLVAIVCAIGYLIAGFTLVPWISIVIGIALLIGAVFVISGKKTA